MGNIGLPLAAEREMRDAAGRPSDMKEGDMLKNRPLQTANVNEVHEVVLQLQT